MQSASFACVARGLRCARSAYRDNPNRRIASALRLLIRNSGGQADTAEFGGDISSVRFSHFTVRALRASKTMETWIKPPYTLSSFSFLSPPWW
jgi:hypothetical protein